MIVMLKLTKLQPWSTASTMPPMNDAQFKLPINSKIWNIMIIALQGASTGFALHNIKIRWVDFVLQTNFPFRKYSELLAGFEIAQFFLHVLTTIKTPTAPTYWIQMSGILGLMKGWANSNYKKFPKKFLCAKNYDRLFSHGNFLIAWSVGHSYRSMHVSYEENTIL